jgi:hypothetical protein
MTDPLLVVALALALAAPAVGDAGDPLTALREGIALVESGDLEAAAQRLEDAIERLGVDPARGRDLASAHLYLALAQLGRGQAGKARVHMREAWIGRKGARLDPRAFPPRAIALYDEVGAALAPRRAGTKLLVGVGAAAAGAGALAGARLAGSDPVAGPPAARPPSSVRVFNADDVGRVSLNGQVLFEVGLGQDSGAVDITSRLSGGANEVVFELINNSGGISYGFEVRQGGAIVFQETCGLAFRAGCEDDRKFPPGVVRRYVYELPASGTR